MNKSDCLYVIDEAVEPLPTGVWLRADSLDPVDWTDENEFLFRSGIMKVEAMTRAEFEQRYPRS